MKNIEEHIDQRVRTFKVPAGRSKDETWELLSSRLDQPQQRSGRVSAFVYWVGAAAAVVLVFLGLFQSGLFAPVTQTITAMQQTVWLPDSSMVLLNSRSKLTSNYQLIGGKRQLELEGEAYFRVKKGKPFQVSFPGGKLQVLGTEFNVNAYSAQYVRIDCVSGKVLVEINKKLITLVKGQGFRLNENTLEGPFLIDQAEVENRLKGIYVWHVEPLDEIFAYIGNRFGYSVSLDPSLQKRNFSGTFTLTNLQQSLEVLSGAMQIKYTIDDKLKRINIEAR
jgi:ferric-dicitrate binding protein FerR (iron transport regulator)